MLPVQVYLILYKISQYDFKYWIQKSGPLVIDTLTTVVLIQICLLRGKLKSIITIHRCNHFKRSFHNKLKNHPRYLDHKPNRQLDDLIHILLKFESDTYMAQRTKQVTYTVYIHKRYYLISAIFFKVMKSPKDASLKLEGERHSPSDSNWISALKSITLWR